MSKLQTSPLLFLRPGNKVTLEGRALDLKLNLSDIDLLSFFAEPASESDAIAAGYDSGKISSFISEGMLVPQGADGEFCRAQTWEVYNLQRAAYLMFNTFDSYDAEGSPRFRTYDATSVDSISSCFSKLLTRRTERFFTDEEIDKKSFEEVINELNAAVKNNHWLSYRILVQGVEGYEKAVYKPDGNGGLEKTVDAYTRKDLMEGLHGQWWLNGAGFCCFFLVSLEALKDKNSVDTPASYFEMIVQLGAAGQALLNTVYKHDLGSWMTPAVSESVAAKILGLDSSLEESLYFFKVGIPQRAEDKSERRSPI